MTDKSKVTEVETQVTEIKTLQFLAADKVEVTADLYMTPNEKAPFIILFHQAGYSRGEYRQIAPKLNEMGYNCMAVDQRSGSSYQGIVNKTNKSAMKMHLSTQYEEAFPDLEAAFNYVNENYKPETLYVWGSSYSASLVFVLAAKHSDQIDGLLAFSPGEYFSMEDKTIADFAKEVTCPVFITSAREEIGDWKGISEAVTSKGSSFFIPKESGRHGSSTLLDSNSNHQEYWNAVKEFLK